MSIVKNLEQPRFVSLFSFWIWFLLSNRHFGFFYIEFNNDYSSDFQTKKAEQKPKNTYKWPIYGQTVKTTKKLAYCKFIQGQPHE